MNQNINELEHRLWLLRGEVNQAMQEYDKNNINLDRLNYMEFEIHHLQEQIKMIKELKNKYPQAQMNENVLPNKLPKTILQPTNIYDNNISLKNKNLDIEKTLGTNIMGIIASILIFISIVIFGGLLIPHLNDITMVVLIFLFSFLLFGCGLFLLRKNNLNKFYLSLCSCGASAICVSLLVTRIYFQLLNNFGLLFLISIWLACMGYLCKKYNKIFQIIGECGLLISVITGIIEINLNQICSWTSLLVLILIFFISIFLFNYLNTKEKYFNNLFSHIVRTIALFVFFITFYNFEINNFIGYLCLSFIVLYYLFEIYVAYKEDISNGGIPFYIISTINMLIFTLIISTSLSNLFNEYQVLYIMSVFIIIYFHFKTSKYYIVGNILSIIMFIVACSGCMYDSIWYSALCIIPLFLYGYIYNKTVFLYAGLISMFGTIFNDWNLINFLILIILPFIMFIITARKENKQMFTSIGYSLFLLFFVNILNDIMFYEFDLEYSEVSTITFIIIAILHIIFIKFNILLETRKTFSVIQYITTTILMCYSISVIYNEFLVLLVIIVMIMLFMINSNKLIKKSELFGYYIALKYTILMVVILSVNWHIAILYSICMLLFALASVTCGFIFNHKSFRIYGLILSMISVFKLILFDVNGKSMTYNAMGFLICGFICFGISFVYNKIEDKFKNK